MAVLGAAAVMDEQQASKQKFSDGDRAEIWAILHVYANDTQLNGILYLHSWYRENCAA